MTILERKNKDGGGRLKLVGVGDVKGTVVLVWVRVHNDLKDTPILPKVRLRCEFVFGEVGGHARAVYHVLLEHPEVYISEREEKEVMEGCYLGEGLWTYRHSY